MSKETNILIVGAGITGLTAAYYLKKKGIPFLIVEEQDRIGGAIQTRQENGFIYESGPNSGVLGQPEALALFEDLGEAAGLEIASKAVNKRYVLKKGRWEAMPMGLMDAIRTPLFTLGDKFRILGEPFRKPGINPDENLANLVRRRMGKSFLDYAVDPFIIGVYAGDPARLIPRYALPKLYRLEQDYGSFVRGAMKKKKLKKSNWEKKATREIFSCSGGLSTLIKALTAEIGKAIIYTGAASCVVQKNGETYTASFTREGKTEEIRAKKVLITTGAQSLPGLLPFLGSEHMDALCDVRQARIVEVALGFRNWKGFQPDAFGGLIPFREKRDILGVLFMSAFLKDRAPEGGALFTVFLGGIRRPEIYELDDEGITEILRREFIELMGVKEFKPDLMDIMRYPYAIPQYEKSSGRRIAAAEEAERMFPGLFLRGNFLGGIGLADRIKQGRALADRLNEA